MKKVRMFYDASQIRAMAAMAMFRSFKEQIYRNEQDGNEPEALFYDDDGNEYVIYKGYIGSNLCWIADTMNYNREFCGYYAEETLLKLTKTLFDKCVMGNKNKE